MRNLVFSALLVLTLVRAASAQEEPSLKPSTPRVPEAPTLISLQVRYNSALPSAFINVREAEVKPRWIWVTRFARTPGWQEPAGTLPLRAVRVEAQYNGESANIRVTLLRGVQTFDREDLVGTYQLSLGEKKVITKLTSFGVEPFELTLENTVSPLPPAPTFDNRTKAVEVVSVQSENVPLPAYRLTLRNVSEQNILALAVETFNDGRRGTSAVFQGELGRPLIQPGSTLEKFLPVGVSQQTTPGSFTPGVAGSYLIVIRTAVFDDGGLSHDGEPEPACMFRSFVVGRRLWLSRVVGLLTRQLAASNNDQSEAPQLFKENFLSSISRKSIDDNEADYSNPFFCQTPGTGKEAAFKGLTLEFLRDLDRQTNTRPVPSQSFKSWLESKRAEYEAWLKRLQPLGEM